MENMTFIVAKAGRISKDRTVHTEESLKAMASKLDGKEITDGTNVIGTIDSAEVKAGWLYVKAKIDNVELFKKLGFDL